MVVVQKLIENFINSDDNLPLKKRFKEYTAHISSVYRFVLGICIASQISTVFYNIFASDLSLQEMFLPSFPSPRWKMSSTQMESMFPYCGNTMELGFQHY